MGFSVGDQLFLERFIWFDQEARIGCWPNASTLACRFELSTKTAHRSIDYFRDRLHAPLEYDESCKGCFHTIQTHKDSAAAWLSPKNLNSLDLSVAELPVIQSYFSDLQAIS